MRGANRRRDPQTVDIVPFGACSGVSVAPKHDLQAKPVSPWRFDSFRRRLLSVWISLRLWSPGPNNWDDVDSPVLVDHRSPSKLLEFGGAAPLTAVQSSVQFDFKQEEGFQTASSNFMVPLREATRSLSVGLGRSQLLAQYNM